MPFLFGFKAKQSAALKPCPSARPGWARSRANGAEGYHPVCTSRSEAKARKIGDTAPFERSDLLTVRGAEPLPCPFSRAKLRSTVQPAEGVPMSVVITAWSGAGAQWRRSISLPFAGSKPHERVSSRAYLGLSTGIGINLPKGLSRIA